MYGHAGDLYATAVRAEMERQVEEEDKEPQEDEWKGVYPGMCINPEICRGYSHCPRDYSCSE